MTSEPEWGGATPIPLPSDHPARLRDRQLAAELDRLVAIYESALAHVLRRGSALRGAVLREVALLLAYGGVLGAVEWEPVERAAIAAGWLVVDGLWFAGPGIDAMPALPSRDRARSPGPPNAACATCLSPEALARAAPLLSPYARGGCGDRACALYDRQAGCRQCGALPHSREAYPPGHPLHGY